jgi:hypothetical protein
MAEQDATPPPDGFYWFERPNRDLEVVQVDHGEISVIDGNDEGFRLESWPEGRYRLRVLEGRLLRRVNEPPTEQEMRNILAVYTRLIDHADLLRRYVRLVVQEEGYDFLPRLGSAGNDVQFNAEELALLTRLSEEANT